MINKYLRLRYLSQSLNTKPLKDGPAKTGPTGPVLEDFGDPLGVRDPGSLNTSIWGPVGHSVLGIGDLARIS